MQVPFIGSYCIYDASNNLIEMNPITLDSVSTQCMDLPADPLMRPPLR